MRTIPTEQAAPHPTTPIDRLQWDIFCRVIDNHGDLGVCWRLSVQLARLGHRVRLWVDDAQALAWMAPEGQVGVEVLNWTLSVDPDTVTRLPRADVWVEAFGCDIESEYVANTSIRKSAEDRFSLNFPIWINLEYLTAETYAQRCHGLPSPVMSGPARGQIKHFFYPGFVPGTGGLLREPDLAHRQARFDKSSWLQTQGVDWRGERLVSLFCYEPAALPALLDQLANAPEPTLLLVTHGRASQAVEQAVTRAGWRAHGQGALRIHPMPPLPQTGFDELLWACDLNFVRGEDSLVRALWAGKPLVWHIYPQHDDAHLPKLQAFLDWLQAPDNLRQWHAAWNPSVNGSAETALLMPMRLPDGENASLCVQGARQRLVEQPDLVSQLLELVARAQAGQRPPGQHTPFPLGRT